jgi:thioredoxin 1
MLEIDKGISVVKFSAMWCAPCKLLNPIMKKIVEEFPKVKVFPIDVDDQPQLAKTYKIRNLPSVIFIRDGQEVNRIVGTAKIDAFRKVLREITKDQAA